LTETKENNLQIIGSIRNDLLESKGINYAFAETNGWESEFYKNVKKEAYNDFRRLEYEIIGFSGILEELLKRKPVASENPWKCLFF